MSEFSIDINHGQRILKVRGGFPLLGTLATQGVYLPSACGGRASCGACRIKLLSPAIPHRETELPLISEGDRNAGMHLACQLPVDQDLCVEVPASTLGAKKAIATLTSIEDVTWDIKLLSLSLPDAIAASMSFLPGQYVQLIIPPYGESSRLVQRAYSIASSPSRPGLLQLLVRLVPGGIGSTWVHTMIEAGKEVKLIGPFGDFHLRDTQAVALFVGGGSGMSPFRSMLSHMAETGHGADREVWYFFGAKTRRDLFMEEEMAEFSRLLPRFHFVPALSEPAPGDDWKGETGLITDVLDRYLKGPYCSPGIREGYLCGSPGMIGACIRVMNANGVRDGDIFYDKFS